MRKLIVWLIAAVLTTFGIVGISGAPASATKCPYTGCVETATEIHGPKEIVKGGILPIHVKVSAKAGTANPRGTLHATCSRPGKTRHKSRHYSGHPRVVTFKLHKVATWHCTVKFTSHRKFKPSSDSLTVSVVPR